MNQSWSPLLGRQVSPSSEPYWHVLVERLAWRYGPERAYEIVRGRDTLANADLQAWRNLGRGHAD